jgi:hypothetical protein
MGRILDVYVLWLYDGMDGWRTHYFLMDLMDMALKRTDTTHKHTDDAMGHHFAARALGVMGHSGLLGEDRYPAFCTRSLQLDL